ncbi:MAG TPA: hypothetical protein VNK41_00135 [Vicinamibacterales bacterium]|nr:hypothetical protein [Vicinamibacterales bacterium]
MKPKKTGRWPLLPLGLAFAALVYAAAVAPVSGEEADPPRQTATAEKEASAGEPPAADTGTQTTTVSVGSVTIGVDPKTGDLRNVSRAEAAQLAREMRKLFTPRSLERVVRPDGSLSAVVSPNVLRFSVARIEPDGRVTQACAPGQDAALEFLTRGATQTAPEAKEE